jgi:hypothetical protein
MVKTDLGREFSGRNFLFALFTKLYLARAMTPAEGARALVLATTVSSDKNGKFVAPGLDDAEYLE